MKQVNKIIKKQTRTASHQDEWNNIIKALEVSTEKNVGYKDKKQRPKNSAPFIDSERYQHQIKIHQRRTKK